MNDFSAPQEEFAHRFMSVTMQGEFNCKEAQSRVLTYFWYKENKGGGDVVYSDNNASEWKSVVSDREEEKVLKFACERKWRWW
jgi:hypothetical protein